jgi:hypothetical protein
MDECSMASHASLSVNSSWINPILIVEISLLKQKGPLLMRVSNCPCIRAMV